MQIRAQQSANTQVTDEVKTALIGWFQDRGVAAADEFLFHHYQGGDFVAVSYGDSSVADTQALAECWDEIFDYWRNKRVNDHCVHLHREWVNSI